MMKFLRSSQVIHKKLLKVVQGQQLVSLLVPLQAIIQPPREVLLLIDFESLGPSGILDSLGSRGRLTTKGGV